MKDKLKIILISVITIFCIYKIINWVIRPSYAYSSGKSKSDEQLIARAINGEARGESYKGQVAVGAVILNRVNSSKFPDTATSSWIWSKTTVKTIGKHNFCK